MLCYAKANVTAHDELVAGPSGVGYAYPSTWRAADMDAFVGLTADAMGRAGMRVVNVRA